jgi:hypothetical protein
MPRSYWGRFQRRTANPIERAAWAHGMPPHADRSTSGRGLPARPAAQERRPSPGAGRGPWACPWPVSQIENGKIPRQTLSVSSSSRARSSEAATGRSDRPDPPARYRRRPRRAAPRNGPQDLQEIDDIKIVHQRVRQLHERFRQTLVAAYGCLSAITRMRPSEPAGTARGLGPILSQSALTSNLSRRATTSAATSARARR